jgi:selenocysteine-specific elongation factor
MVELAQPGSRVAINLANVSRSDLSRGDVVALPGQLRTTMLIDAHLQLLSDAPRPLAHNTQVDFYSGSQEIPARVRLLDVEELQPGRSAWVQLRLSKAAVLARRDRFIVRIPSPSTTIGGGEVVDVQPRYHRRFQQPILERLATLERGTPEELVLSALDRRDKRVRPGNAGGTGGTSTQTKSKGLIGYELAEIVKQSNLAQDVTLQTLETLLTEGRVRRLGAWWFAQSVWEALVEETTRLLSEHHRHYPLRSGLSKEEWRTRLGLSPKMAAEIFVALQSDGVIVDAATASTSSSGVIRLPDFTPGFTPVQQQQVIQLLRQFRDNPFTPPGRSEAEALVGAEVLAALIEQGQLVKLGDGILFLRETYDEALATIVHYLREHGKITAAEARDLLGATRKYILPLLEHMDTLKVTRRIGDERVLGTSIPPGTLP